MLDIRPTQICVQNPIFGPRNLGHYFGSMADLVKNQYKYKSIVIIDDVMAIFMNPTESNSIKNRSYFVIQDFINSGFDCEKNDIIMTSQILDQLVELINVYGNFIDYKHCNYLYDNSFLGGLKSYQREELGLSLYPSVFEILYPQLGMPALSLGLEVELFQGGEEIMGYTYIMKHISDQIRSKVDKYNFSPEYEPSSTPHLLGLDGTYMFQHNSVFLAEEEEDLNAKIDTINDKKVLIEWFNALEYYDIAKRLEESDDFTYEKLLLKEILVDKLKIFRDNKISIDEINGILNKSKKNISAKLEQSIIFLKENFFNIQYE
jgi:tryptophanyl-tRNA synthetase